LSGLLGFTNANADKYTGSASFKNTYAYANAHTNTINDREPGLFENAYANAYGFKHANTYANTNTYAYSNSGRNEEPDSFSYTDKDPTAVSL
jgi:hypothetical protein